MFHCGTTPTKGLIPYCDNIVKRISKCIKCNENDRPAIFSHRLTDQNEQIVIGTTNYMTLCRKCYLESNTQY